MHSSHSLVAWGFRITPVTVASRPFASTNFLPFAKRRVLKLEALNPGGLTAILFNFFRCRPGIHIPRWYASRRLLPLSVCLPLLRSGHLCVRAQLETKDEVGEA